MVILSPFLILNACRLYWIKQGMKNCGRISRGKQRSLFFFSDFSVYHSVPELRGRMNEFPSLFPHLLNSFISTFPFRYSYDLGSSLKKGEDGRRIALGCPAKKRILWCNPGLDHQQYRRPLQGWSRHLRPVNASSILIITLEMWQHTGGERSQPLQIVRVEPL